MFGIGDRIRCYDLTDDSRESYWVGVIKEIHPQGWTCTTTARKLRGLDVDIRDLPETFGAPAPFERCGIILNFVELEEDAPAVEAKKAKKR